MEDDLSSDKSAARAYALALRFLGVRMRSRREIVDYLARKGCEPNDVDAVMAELASLGLIDDAKFADAWIADRMNLRPRSRAHLAQELMTKGIERDDIDAAFGRIENGAELEALKRLIERKRRTGYHDGDKLVGYLQRQGYQWSLIQRALKDLDESD